jgi:Zn-dependent protease/CBS domain-containing protein
MRGSFKIATIFGIDLKVHFTFFILVLLAAMQGSAGSGDGSQVLFNVGFITLLFGCVTLHELGHALVARRYGITVREIVLLPIGGVAVMGRIPENPRQELLIAIAGPLVNVLILALLVPTWLTLTGGFTGFQPLLQFLRDALHLRGPAGADLGLTMVRMLIGANSMLILFNMIPAFPLDGGRIFRATLAFFMPHVRATRIAAGVGQFAAVGLAVYGLYGNIFLTIIAFFIFMNAGAESSAAQAGTVLATKRVGDAYNKMAISLTMDHRVSHVIEYLLTSYQPDFAVVNRGNLVGVVTRDDVLRWLAQTPSFYDVYVTEVMREEQQVVRVDTAMSLDEVVKVMTDRDTRIVAVFEADHFLGLVSAEDIAEAQAVLTFLNRRLQDGAASRHAWPAPLQQAPRT